MRETCADWQRGMEPQDDPALKGKKDQDNGFKLKVPRRNVGMSQFCDEKLFFLLEKCLKFCFVF